MVEVRQTLDGLIENNLVKLLMGLSRIIVLDCREKTCPLIEEATIILTSDLIRKTIFVSDEHGRCEIFWPLVSQGSVSRDAKVYVVTESQILPAIRIIKGYKKGSPRAELSIDSLRTVGDYVQTS